MDTKARVVKSPDGEFHLVTKTGKVVNYRTYKRQALLHARRLNAAAERSGARLSLGLVRTPYGWE